MTQFELFCVIFYALYAVWEKTGGKEFRESDFKDDSIQNEDLRMFLSDANPSFGQILVQQIRPHLLSSARLCRRKNLHLRTAMTLQACISMLFRTIMLRECEMHSGLSRVKNGLTE